MNCYLCRQPLGECHYRSGSGDVFRCPACGTSCNRLSGGTDGYYDGAYFDRHYLPVADQQKVRSRRYLEKVQTLGGNGRLLDFGCGTGVFLAEAAARKFHPSVGVDVSTAALDYARERVGEAVELGGPEIVCGEYGVITFLDTLAHIPSGGEVLRRLVAQHLSPGGIVLVRTPAYNRSYFAYLRLLRLLLPDRFVAGLYGLPLRYFLASPAGLRSCLEGCGLELLELTLESVRPSPLAEQSWRGWCRYQLFTMLPWRVNRRNSLVAYARKPRGAEEGTGR